MIFNGENIKVEIRGSSHAEKIEAIINGIPKDTKIDKEFLSSFMARRAPGKNSYSTPRKEPDEVIFTKGVKDYITTGGEIAATIYNTNTKSKDYTDNAFIPRPGHADYTGYIKYGETYDNVGGGAFSGRMTAPLCIAGAICISLLKEMGVEIISRVYSIGDVKDRGELLFTTAKKDFPVVDDTVAPLMIKEIENAKENGDSVGGIVEVSVKNFPAGIGGPMFMGIEGKLSYALFAIPAVKGVSFGSGFSGTKIRGSENNDPFYVKNGKIRTKTNNSGGILGGISNGENINFKVAFKPTPSIAKEQESVNLKTMENVKFSVKGRHDPCVVVRAVPVVEAAAAIVLYDMIKGEK